MCTYLINEIKKYVKLDKMLIKLKMLLVEGYQKVVKGVNF